MNWTKLDKDLYPTIVTDRLKCSSIINMTSRDLNIAQNTEELDLRTCTFSKETALECLPKKAP